jgi:hypothetical protein
MSETNPPAPAPPTPPPPAPAPAPAPPPKPGAKDEPEKVTLTVAELDKRVSDALAEQQRKADAKAAKDREAAEAEEAKKRGEFEKLAEKEKQRADALEAQNRTLRTATALRDHLAAKHPDYIGCSKYILPLIPADTADDALPKAIETAAAEYVKDNPRDAKERPGGGAPPALPRGRGTDTAPRAESRQSPTRRPFAHLSRNY